MGVLVSAAWLAERLGEAGVVVLDATLPPVGVVPVVDTRGRYRAEHIPGAMFFDIEELSDRRTALPHMLPPAEEFAAKMSAMGVGDGMTIVVYEQVGVFSAPRAWWMLRTFGARDVRVLDGGLAAWVEAGFATEAGEGARPAAEFTARLNADAVRDFAQVRELLAAGAQVLDARSAGRFAGTAPEPRAGLSSGHMPGSVGLPFGELVEAGRLKDADGLRAVFQAKGVDLERPVTTTCGSGVTAAVLALGLELAGAKQVGLYDGSWAEYASRPEAMIVRAEQG
jgi:thiosulfate/3-mercaptopyruvate sulfurtransferase